MKYGSQEIPLKEKIEQFDREIIITIDDLDHINRLSKKLLELPVEELGRELNLISELLEEATQTLRKASVYLFAGIEGWGESSFSPIASTSSNSSFIPMSSSTATTSTISPSSLQSELSSLIAENPSLFPIVKLLSFIAADGSLIYNSDSAQRLSDLTQNPASDYYKRPPKKKMLGDLGEINVLKILVDPMGKDRLSEQEINEIQIKASLKSRISNRNPEPDFYVPSRRLVIDAKAWKNLSISNLNKVIQKYVNLECVNQGGEVRLYFPLDVYEQNQTLLSKLPKQVNNVKVCTAPMEITYEELNSQRKIMLIYLKSLILPNQLKSQISNRKNKN